LQRARLGPTNGESPALPISAHCCIPRNTAITQSGTACYRAITPPASRLAHESGDAAMRATATPTLHTRATAPRRPCDGVQAAGGINPDPPVLQHRKSSAVPVHPASEACGYWPAGIRKSPLTAPSDTGACVLTARESQRASSNRMTPFNVSLATDPEPGPKPCQDRPRPPAPCRAPRSVAASLRPYRPCRPPSAAAPVRHSAAGSARSAGDRPRVAPQRFRGCRQRDG